MEAICARKEIGIGIRNQDSFTDLHLHLVYIITSSEPCVSKVESSQNLRAYTLYRPIVEWKREMQREREEKKSTSCPRSSECWLFYPFFLSTETASHSLKNSQHAKPSLSSSVGHFNPMAWHFECAHTKNLLHTLPCNLLNSSMQKYVECDLQHSKWSGLFFSCCLWRGLSLGCLKNTTKAQHKPHAQSNQTHSALNCVLTNRTGFALIWLQSDFARHFQTFFFFISFFLAPNPSSPPHILPTNLNYTPTLVGNKSDSNYYTTHQSEIENERHYQHWRRGDGWYWNEIKPHRRLLRLWLED